MMTFLIFSIFKNVSAYSEFATHLGFFLKKCSSITILHIVILMFEHSKAASLQKKDEVNWWGYHHARKGHKAMYIHSQ